MWIEKGVVRGCGDLEIRRDDLKEIGSEKMAEKPPWSWLQAKFRAHGAPVQNGLQFQSENKQKFGKKILSFISEVSVLQKLGL